MNIPCKVIIELYWREEHIMNPGKTSSNLNINDKLKPINPPIKPDKIYNNPINIWLVL